MELINHKNAETYAPNAPAKKTKYFVKFQNAWKSEFKWCQASSKGPVFSVLRYTIQQSVTSTNLIQMWWKQQRRLVPPTWTSVPVPSRLMLNQSFWNTSIGPRGQKIMRSANNVGNAGPHVRQTFLNNVFTYLTEVVSAGRIVNTGTSSVNSDFVTALNTWYFICFW